MVHVTQPTSTQQHENVAETWAGVWSSYSFWLSKDKLKQLENCLRQKKGGKSTFINSFPVVLQPGVRPQSCCHWAWQQPPTGVRVCVCVCDTGWVRALWSSVTVLKTQCHCSEVSPCEQLRSLKGCSSVRTLPGSETHQMFKSTAASGRGLVIMTMTR